MTLIDNNWYVGCPSGHLSRWEPLATQIGEHKIVLFRDDRGQARALVDRCCHRGFPLSRSSRTAAGFRCGYHGWEFDSDGRCVKIPSQRADRPIPKSYRVAAYQCREQDGYVWIWMGGAEPAELPRIPELDTGAWLQGSMAVRCHYLRALEITFDMCHVPFVHPTHPRTILAREHGLVETTYVLEETADGCIVFTPTAPNEPPDFSVEFRLPGTVRFEIRTDKGSSYMFFFVTPLTEISCRMDWLVSDTSATDGGGAIRWHGEGGVISLEDRAVLELVQPAYDREGESFERSVEADAPTLLLRRLVKAAERGERLPGRRAGTQRTLSTVSVPRGVPGRSSNFDPREGATAEQEKDECHARERG